MRGVRLLSLFVALAVLGLTQACAPKLLATPRAVRVTQVLPREEEEPLLTTEQAPAPEPTFASTPWSPPIGGQGEGAVTKVAPTLSPAIPERRRLTLEWPPTLRVGDADVIRLTLEVDEMGGITPTAEIEGHQVRGETVSIPNLYETHDVIAEARLDMAGAQVRPQGPISEALLPGQPVTFYWSVRLMEAGRYRGTVWLHLRFRPKSGGEEVRRAVSAQFIEVEAVTLFGLGGGAARAVGALGSALGTVLGFPFVGDAFRWLWRRVRRRGEGRL